MSRFPASSFLRPAGLLPARPLRSEGLERHSVGEREVRRECQRPWMVLVRAVLVKSRALAPCLADVVHVW